ncbi:hypothetical protein SB2_11815 [Methylobacterium radiotolerans]|nr:hypothetical protein SB3_11010 [Methylobacterium radiotolerans]KTS47979.1 hypothetical protein SB2_11815 [Methylobacterium radiotolerans]
MHRSGRRQSDHFDVELSITATERFGFGLAEWTDFDPQEAKVIMSSASDGSDEREMITGMVDMPAVNLREMTVSVQGRDKSASLGEKPRQEKFNNQKTKDIVEKIAKDHKLTAQVELPDEGGEYAGKTYDQDTAHLILNRTDWEVLNDLAEREGCRWYVDGSTLYFEPDDQSNGSYDVVWQPPGTAAAYTVANVMDIALKRNMTAGRPHKVRVGSFHHRLRKVFQAEATTPGVGDVLTYQDEHPGRNQKQVEKLAKARAKSLIRHELGVVIKAPGDLSVDVRQDLNLSGTGTIYDQRYDIDAVDFIIDWGEGFGMTIQATGAKKGRDVSVSTKSIGGKSINENGPATKTVPLPPQRPASLGGGASGGTSL